METANVKEPVFHHRDHKLYIIRLLKLPTFDNLMRKNKGSDLHVLYNTGKKSSRLQTRMIKKKMSQKQHLFKIIRIKRTR